MLSERRRIQRREAYRTWYGYSEVARGSGEQADYRSATDQKRSGVANLECEIERNRRKYRKSAEGTVSRYVHGVCGRLPLFYRGGPAVHAHDARLLGDGTE